MNERTRMDVAKRYDTSAPNTTVREIAPPKRYTLPKYEDRVTPYVHERRFPDGSRNIEIHLPYCVFPAYRNDGKPSFLRVKSPDHPIVRGVPRGLVEPKTEVVGTLS